MSQGPEDEPTGGDPEEGPVLSPEELDISEDEHVREIGEGRYVVSPDPIADDEPGAIEASASADAESPEELPPGDGASTADGAADSTPSPDSDAKSAPGPDARESGSTSDSLSRREVHAWLSTNLEGANSRYGFDITGKFDGSIAQRRMVSNDVVTIFESLVLWYAQQIDRDTPVEEVLGILLVEANVPIQYPPESLRYALQSTGLSPDDTIADLMQAINEDGGFQLE